MPNILLPLDFSPLSSVVFRTAFEIAQRTDGTLHLYHCLELPKNWSYLLDQEALQEDAIEKLMTAAREKLALYLAEAKAADVAGEVHLKMGDFSENMTTLVSDIAIDLVVMGAHGAKEKMEGVYGSNTQKALRQLACKILVVQENTQLANLKNILFATNLLIEDQTTFQYFLDFSPVFPIEKIHLLTVRTNSFFSIPNIVIQAAQKDFIEMAAPYEVVPHQTKDLSVYRGIDEFIQDNNIDMVVVSNHRSRPIKHMLWGSNVELIAEGTQVPVLSINYSENLVT